jgi:hypothetical protein
LHRRRTRPLRSLQPLTLSRALPSLPSFPCPPPPAVRRPQGALSRLQAQGHLLEFLRAGEEKRARDEGLHFHKGVFSDRPPFSLHHSNHPDSRAFFLSPPSPAVPQRSALRPRPGQLFRLRELQRPCARRPVQRPSPSLGVPPAPRKLGTHGARAPAPAERRAVSHGIASSPPSHGPGASPSPVRCSERLLFLILHRPLWHPCCPASGFHGRGNVARGGKRRRPGSTCGFCERSVGGCSGRHGP